MFWPYGYWPYFYDPFWYYGYPDLYAGIFWPYGYGDIINPPPVAYGGGGGYVSGGPGYGGPRYVVDGVVRPLCTARRPAEV